MFAYGGGSKTSVEEIMSKKGDEQGQDLNKFTLDVDLKQGVKPISKAAAALAALIKRSNANHQPIIVTNKGYPFGVILEIELLIALCELANKRLTQEYVTGAAKTIAAGGKIDEKSPLRLYAVDLKEGVVPISRAASALNALFRRSRANQEPIIVTQKGYPTGGLLHIDVYTALRKLAELQLSQEQESIDIKDIIPEAEAPGDADPTFEDLGSSDQASDDSDPAEETDE